MRAKSLMIQGTGSNVGKSIIACALCRILSQDGYRVAPFKAQNMSLNSFVTKDGKEMGRAQVAQAEAAGVDPMVEMNPILLKPIGDCGSQVVVMGKPLRNMSAQEYYKCKGEMLVIVKDAYNTLASQFDIIVIEGAGSPAEINLKENDIVNMKMAEIADAPVVLVTDIDRGGAFAWIVGTFELLNETERNHIFGIVFNKFRGDPAILQPGIDMLERRTGKQVLGLVPFINGLSIDDEDSVSLDNNPPVPPFAKGGQGEIIDIAIIKLPRISNFTDFDSFEHHNGVSIRYVDDTNGLGNPDVIILPGTKNTIGDLLWIRANGLENAIIKCRDTARHAPTMIIGICGGYQMMGKEILDVECVESNHARIQGMGLLDVTTTFLPEKCTYQAKANLLPDTLLFSTQNTLTGYEIHMGRTILNNGIRPLLRITERSDKPVDVPDGAVSHDGMHWGTYFHGIFDNDEFRSQLINFLRKKKGLSPPSIMLSEEKNLTAHKKEIHYDNLADIVRNNIKMNLIYKRLGLK
ncbi:MAG: cobyric acid synthase [Planctomycetes bacterium]|nr:cobyric acid synthase [Planctomycetota bacterium]